MMFFPFVFFGLVLLSYLIRQKAAKGGKMDWPQRRPEKGEPRVLRKYERPPPGAPRRPAPVGRAATSPPVLTPDPIHRPAVSPETLIPRLSELEKRFALPTPPPLPAAPVTTHAPAPAADLADLGSAAAAIGRGEAVPGVARSRMGMAVYDVESAFPDAPRVATLSRAPADVRAMLSQRDSLRAAWVASLILGPPAASQ